MKEQTGSKPEMDWRPDACRRGNDEITQPLRILCARPAQGPFDRLAAWFKKKEAEARRTLDWTQIGGKPAA